ncbi:MAG: metalloregulator ArsR/SmtB family transcription factor [Pseudomonadales bacterium]
MSRAEAARAGTTAVADAAPVFAALGDATRLGLIRRLCDGGPQSIVALSAGFGLSRQAVTKHLRVLARAGLVAADAVGRERRYRLTPQRLTAARAFLEAVDAQWDDALARLQAHVER